MEVFKLDDRFISRKPGKPTVPPNNKNKYYKQYREMYKYRNLNRNRKPKKGSFNIVNKKRGPKNIHSQYYYDGRTASTSLVNYIESQTKVALPLIPEDENKLS